VRLTAANTRRAEESRQRRQLEYQTMSQLLSSESPESTWQQLRPVLDDTLHELGEKDRTAIVLRFFENLSLQQVGMQLGLNENAARMRVERALRKLRERLTKRGITSSSSALAAAILVGAVTEHRVWRPVSNQRRWTEHSLIKRSNRCETFEICPDCKKTRSTLRCKRRCSGNDVLYGPLLVPSCTRSAPPQLADALERS